MGVPVLETVQIWRRPKHTSTGWKTSILKKKMNLAVTITRMSQRPSKSYRTSKTKKRTKTKPSPRAVKNKQMVEKKLTLKLKQKN